MIISKSERFKIYKISVASVAGHEVVVAEAKVGGAVAPPTE